MSIANQSDQKLPKIHFQNLDALRFIAAFSVFIFHYFADIKALFPKLNANSIFHKLAIVADKGTLGVNFFFVLSGFLITYLILEERKKNGHFSLKKFLIRRTLRIWPLYFIIVLIGFVIFPVLIEGFTTLHNPWMYVAFLANFDELNVGLQDSVNFLTSPWSVAVEEQFYLFWGCLVFLLFRIKSIKLIHIIFILYALSLCFTWLNISDERVIYYHTFAVCQDILTGTLIGLALFEKQIWLEKLKNLKKFWVILIYLFGVGICIAKNKLFFGDLLIFERMVLSVFFAFIILDQMQGIHSFFKFGRIKLFNYLGKISYGLYMYHLVIMYLSVLFIDSWDYNSYHLIWVQFGFSLIGTIAIASTSYYLIEKPLLKLKPH